MTGTGNGPTPEAKHHKTSGILRLCSTNCPCPVERSLSTYLWRLITDNKPSSLTADLLSTKERGPVDIPGWRQKIHQAWPGTCLSTGGVGRGQQEVCKHQYTIKTVWVHLVAIWSIISPTLFQKTMKNLLQGLKHVHVCVYLDDILVPGTSERNHLDNLAELLKRLDNAGMRLSVSSCSQLWNTYIGHKISDKGLQPMEGKIQAIIEAPVPKVFHSLRPSYVGMLNYYAKSLPTSPTLQILRKQSIDIGVSNNRSRLTTEVDSGSKRCHGLCLSLGTL